MTQLTTDIDLAVAALRRGGLVAFPTETVYGLGADAADGTAVSAIFAAKGRPSGHPLIVHLASVDDVADWAHLDGPATAMIDKVAAAFWPGPLTVVVPRSDRVAAETVGGRDTVGIRVPSHPVAQELLRAFGGGIAAPSANRFGHVSPTTASHVVDDLGGVVDVVLDGGPTEVGIESTILELVGGPPTLLRPGAVTADDIERAVGMGVSVADDVGGEARASGMLRSHYAPAAAVQLVAPAALEAELARAEVAAAGSAVGVIVPETVTVDHENLWSLPADAAGYATRLYSALREADAAGVTQLLVAPPASGPLLRAVLDRLTKAAAPRR
ncbi:MAG: L-threonylcarbamoyladenylate synthase [Acidimicrobiales bacterium]